MLTKRMIAAGLALFLVSACAQSAPEGEADDGVTPPLTAEPAAAAATGGDACNSSAVVDYLGQEASEETRAALLEAIAPLENVRWVGPNDAMTMDYLPDRLTVELDESGLITTASCG